MNSSWTIRELVTEDISALQELFSACSDYFVLFEGRDVRPNEAELFFLETPDTISLEAKKLFGIFAHNELVGIIDWIVGYPNPQSLFVGLLLIHPELRGQKIGEELFKFTHKNLGLNSPVHIFVEYINSAAIHFWESLGFQKVREFTRNISGKEIVFVEMFMV